MLVRSLKKILPFLFSKNVDSQCEKKPTKSAACNRFYSVVPLTDKFKAMNFIIKNNNIEKSVIFCSRKRDVYLLQKYLRTRRYFVKSIFHTRDQEVVYKVYEEFQKHDRFHLVIFDDALREKIIETTEYVFHFDIPSDLDSIKARYNHLKKGNKINTINYILTDKEQNRFADIEDMYDYQIIPLDLPLRQNNIEKNNSKDEVTIKAKKTYPKKTRRDPLVTPRDDRVETTDGAQLPGFIHKPTITK
jgi:superfamily II DNA/RNA helicase